jgi:hypothetical protein
MNKFNKTLLMYYKMGWNDCADGNTEKHFKQPILQRAYNIGWCDFIAGDDISSVDLQTHSEILKHICKIL